MKPLPPIAAAAWLLTSCSNPAPTTRPAAQVAPPAGPAAAPAPGLPERIVIPASYRLVLLEGRLELVRESDAQALAGSPASIRVVTGEIARGELAYQPGLLPQELAAEVAANRESAARMDNALGDVMRRSRELSAEALAMQAEAERLARMLSEAARPRAAAPASAGSGDPAADP